MRKISETSYISVFIGFLAIGLCLVNSVSRADPFEAGLKAMERKHYATAMRAWLSLAKDGVPQAQNNIGHLYERGYGVSQNYGEAMKWYKQASAEGLAEAEHNVGMLYSQGFGVAKNDQEAVKWFRRAAKQELADSQYMLALSYYEGKGVKLSYTRSKALFLKAALQGYPPAQFMYAYMLQAGEGAKEPDSYKALVWGLIAVRNAQKEAQDLVNIAKLMLEDEETEKARQSVKVCIKSNYSKCPR